MNQWSSQKTSNYERDNVQWVTKSEISAVPGLLDCVREEIADVVKCVLYLAAAIRLPTHLETLVLKKLRMDNKKFPVSVFKGKSKTQIINPKTKREAFPDIPKGGTLPTASTIDLQRKAWKIVEERDWEKFYTPASLALAISNDCGEVATCYQWRIKSIKQPYERAVWALADILINVMRLCEYLELGNIHPLVIEKLEADEKRFAAMREA